MKHGTIAISAAMLIALAAPATAAQAEPQALRVPAAPAASPEPTAPAAVDPSTPAPAPPTGPATPTTGPSQPAAGDEAAAKKAAKKAAKQAAKQAAKKAAKQAAKQAAKKAAKQAAKKARWTKVKVKAAMSPGSDSKYGVGQLVTLEFGQDIKRRKAVEKAIRVTSGKALPPGAWGWIDGDTAVYRPRRFWPANATIKFRMDLKDVVLGVDGDTRYVGASDNVYVLRTARSYVLRIKNSKHRLYVERNGKVIKSFPVSLGKSAGGYQTRSGIKIITGDKSAALRMTGTDRLSGESWDVVAPYSIRLTPTGEYIHGAPWAYARMGLWNGSHGCTNMYAADAKWLFNRVIAGDPTVTTGTGRPMELWNGTPGSYWNYTWQQWRAKSALR